MGDWQHVKLGDVAEAITVGHVGPMASQYQLTGIPFLRSQNVLPHRLDLSDVKYIGPEFHAKLRKSALRAGDVVTVRTGKPGATAVIPEHWSEINCSDLVVTRPGNLINSHWLSYYINTVAAGFISSHLVGAVQQHFNVSSAREMLLVLPSIPEQQAIAEVLGALDDKIAANTRLAFIADALVRAVYLDVTAEAQEKIGLSRLITLVKDVTDPSLLPADTVYVGLEHISRRFMWLEKFGTTASITSTKSRFVTGDILFGKLRPYFHKVVYAAMSGVCSTDVLVVRPVDEKVAGFALAAIASDEVVQRCSAASEGTRMPRTSWKDLAAVKVAWPGDTAAFVLSEKVSCLRDAVEARLRENKILTTTRDTLLPQLMSGNIRVKDAENTVEEVP